MRRARRAPHRSDEVRLGLPEAAPVIAIGNVGKPNEISPDRDGVRDTVRNRGCFREEN
ncbi:MAG: hypothetical protein OHK0013_08140 [Sandaracinaceae bacterium]